MDEFRGKVAIITGSTEGIGLATASCLMAQGCAVIINGRSSQKLQSAEEKLRKDNPGRTVIGLAADVTATDTPETLKDLAVTKFGRIDILINNAGGGMKQDPIEDIIDADWQKTLEFNLGSVFRICRSVIPVMCQQNYGRIVNVSSLAGRFRGTLSGLAYAAAKAGLQGLTRQLAYDYASFNITVNTVAPGLVETERALSKWQEKSDRERELILAQLPFGRFARPEEISHAILFLASLNASYVTGVTLDVNGGRFMS